MSKENNCAPAPKQKNRSHSVVVKEHRELTSHEREVLMEALRNGQKISVGTFEIISRPNCHERHMMADIQSASEITIWEK
jgi:hypothetical protein